MWQGILVSEERAKAWQKDTEDKDMMLPIAPWLSSKYSPSPYPTVERDSWPETGLQHPHKLSSLTSCPSLSQAVLPHKLSSLTAGLPVTQPLSLPLLTTPAQTKATEAPTFQFSFPPHLCVSFSQQGWGLTPSALLSGPLCS